MIPYILETVNVTSNLLTYYWKLLKRGMQWKKSHQNRMKNKNLYTLKMHLFWPLWPPFFFLQKWLPICKIHCSFLFSLIKTNTFQKQFVKIGLEIKKVMIYGTGPFWPLVHMYLGNGKSHVKSVGILPKDIWIRNIKKKLEAQVSLYRSPNINSLQMCTWRNVQ